MTKILQLLGFNTGPIRAVESLSLSFAWGLAGLVLVVLGLLPLLYYLYRFEERQISKKERYTFLGLRFAFALLFAFLLAGPVLVLNGWVPQKNKIAVLLDNSRSMSIKHEEETRLDKVKKLFVEKKLTERIEQKTGIYPEVFTFSESVSPIGRQEIEQFNIKATGNQTDISKAAQDIAGNLGEGSLLGMVILTDGVHTQGENPAVAMSNLRLPIHFMGPGGVDQSKDWSISIPRPPAVGYLNANVQVRGEIGRHGITEKNVKIQVFRDGSAIDEINVEFEEEQKRADFSFAIACDAEGAFRYEFKLPERDDEITLENNSAAFLLKVVRERFRIQMIAGQPSWESKFIINALSTDPNASLVAWTRLKDDRWLCNRDFEVQPGQRVPTLAEDLKDADVLILRGVGYNFLSDLESEIVNRLESGSLGLLVLPAPKGLVELGYRGTELEKVLPVNLSTEDWRGTPGNMLLPGPETPYNFLRLVDDPMENLEFFATLPKFDGIYEYGARRPGAQILLSSTVRPAADPLPFLLANRAGKGNVLMQAGAPLWSMGFRLVSSNRGMAPYTAYVVNMLKWLANRREDAQVSIELPAARGYTGQAMSIRVWVSNARHQLQSGAQVSLTVSSEKTERTNLTCMETSEKGCYEATFVPGDNSLHKAEAVANLQGRELGRSSVEFLVETPTSEFNDPAVRVDLMTQIASESGGIYADLEDIESLLAAIDAVPGQKLESRILDVRDSWLILLLILLLPLLEWYLRRKRGLS